MTTKETFDFNLQLFAVPPEATIGASSGSIIIEGFATDTSLVSGARTDTVNVTQDNDPNGDWAELVLIEGTSTGTTSTIIGDTTYNYTDQEGWYYTVDVEESRTNVTDTYIFNGTSSAGYGIDTMRALESDEPLKEVASGSQINAGDYTKGLVLDGIGKVTLDGSDAVELGATGKTLSITDIIGEIAVAPDGEFKQTINDANLDFTATSVTIAKDSAGVNVSVNGSVVLTSIDDKQVWNLDNRETLEYNGITYEATSAVVISDTDGNEIINVDGNSVKISGATADSEIEFFDGTLIKGAVTSLSGSADAIVAVANGVVSANDSSADLKNGKATITADGITAVENLVGVWDLGNITTARVLNDSLTFGNVNATISADSSGVVSEVDGAEGEVTLQSAVANRPFRNKVVTVNGKKWTINGSSGAVDTAVFDEEGNITYSGTGTVTSDEAAAITSGNGSSLSLDAKGSVVIKNDAIVGVSGVAGNSEWDLGDQIVASVGEETFKFENGNATITANEDGKKASAITFDGAATLTASADYSTENINVNSKAKWTTHFNTTKDSLIFDDNANVTLGGSVKTTFTASEDDGAVATVQAATVSKDEINESVVLATGQSVELTDGVITAVDSLAGGSDWISKSSTAKIGSDDSLQTWQFSNNRNGATLTANSEGSAISKVNFSNGTVALTGTKVTPVTIGSSAWTITGGDNTATFSTLGSATVSGANTSVNGSENAMLQFKNGGSVTVNGVAVTSEDTALDFVLEDGGISAINGVDTAGEVVVTVKGDTQFGVNGTHTVTNGNKDADVSFYFDGSKELVVNVEDGGAYTVTGGDVDYEVTLNGSAVSANLNGTSITLNGGSKDDPHTALILGDVDDAVSVISGVGFGSTINTDKTDRAFQVVYDIDSDFESGVVIINNTRITITSDDLSSDADALYVNYDGTGDVNSPNITLSPITYDSSDTETHVIQANKGTYNIGQGRTGTIEDEEGSITIYRGRVTIEGNSITDARDGRKEAIDEANTAASIGSTVDAYEPFYNVAKVSRAYANSNVIHYDADERRFNGTVTSASGANIYADVPFASESEISSITLESYMNNPVYVSHREVSSLREAVIYANSASLVAVGMIANDSNNSVGAINHTIFGGDSASTLMVGASATGNNVIRAGDEGSYLYHEGTGNPDTSGVVSMYGGDGNDTLAPGNRNDGVFGGGGKDLFLDSNDVNDVGYIIQDYSVSEGDSIRATRLSATTADALNPNTVADVFDVNGRSIAIAGGPSITIGAGNNTSTGTSAIVVSADPSRTEEIHLAWANVEAGIVNASVFGGNDGAVIRSDNNGDRADRVIGSNGRDTIFAGNGDTILAGAGNDTIYLRGDDSLLGAMVAISEGIDSVVGWHEGFDHDEGHDIINAKVSDVGFTTTLNNDGAYLVATTSGGSLVFGDFYVGADDSNAYQLLVGEDDENIDKVFVMRSDATIGADTVVADRYYSIDRANTLTIGEDVTAIKTVTLGSDEYHNINSLVVNAKTSVSVYGSEGRDTVTFGGVNPEIDLQHYRKAVSLGGGNDMLISGGTDTATAGVDIFVGLNADGTDSIRNFSYYNSDDINNNSNDLLRLYKYNSDGTATVTGTESQVNIRLNSDTNVLILDHDRDKAIQYQLGNDASTRRQVKVGATRGTNNTFTYEADVDRYIGNGNANRDTINVTGSDDVNIWLGKTSKDTVEYKGIGVINASTVTDAYLTLSGGVGNETIFGGGSGSHSSLWGSEGDNSLIGGAGDDVFFIGKGNHTISGANSNDVVYLYNATISDIVNHVEYDHNGGVTFRLNDCSLSIADARSVRFAVSGGLDNGEYWTLRSAESNYEYFNSVKE